MAFWSNQTLLARLPADGIVSDFDSDAVKYCAYELKLGSEAFLTSDDDGVKKTIDPNCQIVIPPGQFALLITKEVVKMPTKAIGFISIKASDKFRGLVNVSGFHVDPGFTGRLKFSVYNAGGQNIVLTRDTAVFLIFFADLDLIANPSYSGQHQNQQAITAQDVMQIQGHLASPAVLDGRLKKLENLVEIWTRVGQGLAIGAFMLLFGLYIKSCAGIESKPAQKLTASDTVSSHAITNSGGTGTDTLKSMIGVVSTNSIREDVSMRPTILKETNISYQRDQTNDTK